MGLAKRPFKEVKKDVRNVWQLYFLEVQKRDIKAKGKAKEGAGEAQAMDTDIEESQPSESQAISISNSQPSSQSLPDSNFQSLSQAVSVSNLQTRSITSRFTRPISFSSDFHFRFKLPIFFPITLRVTTTLTRNFQTRLPTCFRSTF